MAGEVTVTIDPHVHSEGSYDGHEPVELLLEQASEVGLDGIVVTDHDEIDESLRAAELASEYGLLGIPGVEVSTAAGHLLAIGVEERPEPHRPFVETVERIRELGGAAVVPHPFQRTRHGVRKHKIRVCDAIEVFNSWLFTGYRNRRARRFAARNDYPGVAASDAHSARFLGRAYTELTVDGVSSKADLDGDRVVAAIEDGDAEIYGRRQPLYRSTKHYLKGAGRKVQWALRPAIGSLL
ncbi:MULTISPECIES: CehA/McbA family metallohydrolase [Halorussus]|uniref:CehA/McbA family metallohydrolase n=1 Tax=Halorussus TaxID=1070314 RepID=UPI0020A0B3BF|nr:PHP domain-containing protein [Halorussus vallis]USZ77037.1 PHP domain-containing protein [Halorussus vallis]